MKRENSSVGGDRWQTVRLSGARKCQTETGFLSNFRTRGDQWQTGLSDGKQPEKFEYHALTIGGTFLNPMAVGNPTTNTPIRTHLTNRDPLYSAQTRSIRRISTMAILI